MLESDPRLVNMCAKRKAGKASLKHFGLGNFLRWGGYVGILGRRAGLLGVVKAPRAFLAASGRKAS